jgi:GNAT superfamily N-acetyltransferase
MALTDASPSEPDPRVAAVTDVPEYDDYGRALLSLARAGTSRLLVAREDGRFAGHCWLHFDGEHGGLFDLFVLERSRGAGLGRALTQAALTEAAAAGCAGVTLNAEAAAEALYRSLGFRTIGHGRTWWLRDP